MLGDCTVVISVTKEGVKFSTRGDIGTANIVLRQNTTVDSVYILHSFISDASSICVSLVDMCN